MSLSTEPYKGVRDFYPEDQFVQQYIFDAMQRACERFGFEEYNASILEPADLYRKKGAANDELVNEQTYTFIDRGDREVTLRPEMTPSLARMVAARRRELAFPLRWYSIPNVFRYERPQRGRLREHWQLNADLFGVSGIEADVEIILLAHAIMRELGAKESDFEIRINDRRLLEEVLEPLTLTETEHRTTMRLLDGRYKHKDFDGALAEALGDARALALTTALDSLASSAHLSDLQTRLRELGVNNAVVDTSITRGFDYYTGLVFEVFDTAPDNNRALFGGGRYDRLLELFGDETVPAVGFGMGDVTARDFLDTHDLLPPYVPATELMLLPVDEHACTHAMKLAQNLRSEDVTVAINYSCKRTGDQIRSADKLGIPFVIVIGEKELSSGMYTIKQLASGEEHTVAANRIADHLFSSLG